MPPRKPTRRTEITESLLEVLPQKVKRQAPMPPGKSYQTQQQYQSVTHLEREQPIERNHLPINSTNLNGVTIHVNQGTQEIPVHLESTNLRPSESYSHQTTQLRSEEVQTPSFAGQMTFDDEFESSNFSSSHVDYDHSSADENDDLVKRSLVKASNRRAPIEDIEEETYVSTETNLAQGKSERVQIEPTSTRVVPVVPKPEYDRLPQRPGGPARVVRKPSFLSSADESDSSRGQVTYIASTRDRTTLRKEVNDETSVAAGDSDGQPLAREDSAGRRKYEERRLVLRNFEDGLQRKRLNSSKTSSSIDSDTNDRDDNFIQRKGNLHSNAYRRVGNNHDQG